MNDEEVYALVPSSNGGRYACDDAIYGHDLTCGEPVAILIGGKWIEGRIEHSNYPTQKYPDVLGVYAITGVNGPRIGYYFISHQGDVCGLCAGMRVKLLGW